MSRAQKSTCCSTNFDRPYLDRKALRALLASTPRLSTRLFAPSTARHRETPFQHICELFCREPKNRHFANNSLTFHTLRFARVNSFGAVSRLHLHNFSDKALPTSTLAYRLINRIFQKGNFLLESHSKHPFLSLCISGDHFLSGQIARLVTILIAMSRNLIPRELMEPLLDTAFPSLLAIPKFPSFAIFNSSPNYSSYEGKIGKVLRPRPNAEKKVSERTSARARSARRCLRLLSAQLTVSRYPTRIAPLLSSRHCVNLGAVLGLDR